MSTVFSETCANPRALLERACERNVRVRVEALRGGQLRTIAQTKLLAVEPERLLLHWPNKWDGPRPGDEQEVEVYFVLERQRYAFSARNRGSVIHALNSVMRVRTWALSVPTRVERKQQRAHFRVSLNDLAPIRATLASEGPDQPTIAATLVDLSVGGFLALVPTAEKRIVSGAELLVRFTLPEEGGAIDARARCAHVRPVERTENALAGFAFVPCGDPVRDRSNTQRIERFVAERQRVHVRRALAR